MRTYAYNRSRTGGRVSGSVVRYRNKPKTVSRRRRPFPVAVRMPNFKSPLIRPIRPTYRYDPKGSGAGRKIVSHLGNGSTTSSYTYGRKFMSRDMYNMFKNNQEYVISSLNSKRLDSNVYGRQFVGDDLFFNAWNNFQDSLGKAMATVPTNNEKLSSTVHIGTMNVQTTFTNQEIATSYLTIYEIEPRFHMSSAILPALYWQLGLHQQSDTTTDYYTFAYEKPFKSKLFCCYFKVMKSIEIELGAGQSHKHSSTYHINKPLHGCLCNSAASFGTLKGFTKYRMYVVSGTPVNDSNVSLVGNVSTSTVALDVVNNITYNFTYAASTRAKYFMSDGMSAIVNTPNVLTQVQKVADTEA